MPDGGPHRALAVVERCDQCDRPADARCRRCGRPACAEHAAGRWKRCEPCEADYQLRVVPIPRRNEREVRPAAIAVAKKATLAGSAAVAAGSLIAGLAGFWTVARAVTTALGAPLLLGAVALLGLMFFTSFEAIYDETLRAPVRRARFLLERPGGRRRALPPAEPDDE